jgi:hypothetical protein
MFVIGVSRSQLSLKNDLKSKFAIAPNSILDKTPCSCAVFMSGQFKKGSSDQPNGVPALVQETEISYPCTPTGNRLCIVSENTVM